MKIFIAGATGAIGQPLVSQLLLQGHEIFGMTRSKERAKEMSNLGIKPFIADALDQTSVKKAVQESDPEIVIEMLTALPKEYTPKKMKEAALINERLKIEGGYNLQSAAESAGVRRYILQSSAFWYAPGPGLAAEDTLFAVDPSLPVSEAAKTYVEQEKRVLQSKNIEGVALRFGFFYGPGTWYAPDGSLGKQVKAQSYPIVGEGQGVWNFIHIEDAAHAIILSLNCKPGAYNITDGCPIQQAVWLPAYAKWLGAPPPSVRTVEDELRINGPISVYYATQLRAASNEKAKKQLGFQPRPLEWLSVSK